MLEAKYFHENESFFFLSLQLILRNTYLAFFPMHLYYHTKTAVRKHHTLGDNSEE